MSNSNANKLFSEFKSAKDFDAEVKRLRAKGVEPKNLSRASSCLKKDCTPMQWAQKGEYECKWRQENPAKFRAILDRRNSKTRHIRSEKPKKKKLTEAERKKRRKAYLSANKEKFAEYSRQYRQRNVEAVRARERIWRKNNRQKLADKQRRLYHNDSAHSLATTLRRLLNHGLRDHAGSASEFGLDSWDDLVHYLECQFEEGWNWSNRDTVWNVDHLMPLKGRGVDLTKPHHVRAICHYSNLQPLCKKKNIEKLNKVYPEHEANFLRLVKRYESESTQQIYRAGEFDELGG